MKQWKTITAIAAMSVAAIGLATTGQGQQNAMTFFVTSVNAGKGADFGGLAGADAYCQKLASDAGSTGKTWRAYLSQTATGGVQAVNARDRIGKGPWQNAKGVTVAKDIEDLHNDPNINKDTALDEKGNPIKTRESGTNEHDILTGTQMDGTAYAAGERDMTCGNWTKGGEGSAVVGHHDRSGLSDTKEAKSWNSSHATRGCDMASLRATGGGGLIYCFAAN